MTQTSHRPRSQRWIAAALCAVIAIALYVLSTVHYRVFHVLVEGSGISVSLGVFVVAWYARRLIGNSYALVLGFCHLSVAAVAVLHTMAYRGMGILPVDEANTATQLWILASALQCAGFAIASARPDRSYDPAQLALGFGTATAAGLVSIFAWPVFPDCFIVGSGLTPFKVASEYAFMAGFGIGLALLYRNRRHIDATVFGFLAAAAGTRIAASMAFTLYTDVFGVLNVTGHLLTVGSSYFVFRGVIATGIERPQALMSQALRQSEEMKRRIIESSEDCIKILGLDRSLLLLSPGGQKAMEIDNCASIEGADWLGFWSGEDHIAAQNAVAAALNGGKGRFIGFCPTRSGKPKWWDVLVTPIPGEDGRPEFLLSISRDVTEQRQAAENQALLMREVDHRAKNVLAVVQAILHLTPRDTPERYAKALEGRIASLARAHTLLARGKWAGVDLRQLAGDELNHYAHDGSERVWLDGPDVMLEPSSVQPLGMILHELATNAAKYGAFSSPAGRVSLSWRFVAATGGLELRWIETGGPSAPPPSRRGFGSTLIETNARRQLKGELLTDWQPAGLCCTIRLPRQIVVSSPQQSRPAEQGMAESNGPVGLAGLRALVVEDDAVQGLELERLLSSAGCVVIAVAASVEDALSVVSAETIDVAVLDVSVAGVPSFPVAQALSERGVPFLFATGFTTPSEIDPAWAKTPTLRKPYTGQELRKSLRRLLDDARPRDPGATRPSVLGADDTTQARSTRTNRVTSA